MEQATISKAGLVGQLNYKLIFYGIPRFFNIVVWTVRKLKIMTASKSK